MNLFPQQSQNSYKSILSFSTVNGLTLLGNNDFDIPTDGAGTQMGIGIAKQGFQVRYYTNTLQNNSAPTPAAASANLAYNSANKFYYVDSSAAINMLATEAYVTTQIAAAVAGVFDYQKGYNASGGTYPTAADTDPVVATVKKGMVWSITVAGLGMDVGDVLVALVDSPGQTAANWLPIEHNLGYTPLSNVLNSTRIFVGNGSNVATGVNLTLSATGGGFGLSNSGVLTFPNADTSTRGLLTSADWNTFNNKVSSPWTTDANGITYSGGNVGIGGASQSDNSLNIVNPGSGGQRSIYTTVADGGAGIIVSSLSTNPALPAFAVDDGSSTVFSVNNQGLMILGANNVASGEIQIFGSGASGNAVITVTDTGGDLLLNPLAGRVGIGTAAPSSLLHINGTSQTTNIGVGLSPTSYPGIDRLVIRASGNAGATIPLFVEDSSATGLLQLKDDGNLSLLKGKLQTVAPSGSTSDAWLFGNNSAISGSGLAALTQLQNQLSVQVGADTFYIPCSVANTPLT